MPKKQTNRIGVYAGTFDPITNGHIDILLRGLRVFDTVHLAVAGSTLKSTLFSTEERVALVEKAVSKLKERKRIIVASFEGILVDYVTQLGAQAIIRGLRRVSDYEYEAQMALINRHLNSDTETVFLVTSEGCSFISSSIVKDIAINGGDVSGLVPPVVAAELRRRLPSADNRKKKQ